MIAQLRVVNCGRDAIVANTEASLIGTKVACAAFDGPEKEDGLLLRERSLQPIGNFGQTRLRAIGVLFAVVRSADRDRPDQVVAYLNGDAALCEYRIAHGHRCSGSGGWIRRRRA